MRYVTFNSLPLAWLSALLGATALSTTTVEQATTGRTCDKGQHVVKPIHYVRHGLEPRIVPRVFHYRAFLS